MATSFTFSCKVKGLDQFAHAGPALDRVLRAAMVQSLARLQAEVVTRTPVDLGTARNDIQTSIEGFGADLVGRVGGHMEYLPTLEEGRRPGAKPPPFESLIPWVQRHPAAPQSFLTKTGRRSRRKAPSDRSRAFLIARAIGEHGTEGHHMFEEGLRASERAIAGNFRNAVKILAATLNNDG